MNKQSVLIVDDEQEVCQLLENYLSRKDKNVSYSTSLKEGFEKFKAVQPNFLILDHNMPDGYGIDNISKFREIKSSIRVIVISAMSNLKDEALNKGADYFLEKPLKLSVLNSIISAQ
jgi:DNA-binding response OmpR family regulator